MNTAIETETHIVYAAEVDTDDEVQIYVTGPWWLEAHGCADLLPTFDPSVEEWSVTSGRFTYRIEIDLNSGPFATATITVVD